MPVSVVKADGVQGGGATNRVRRKISILWLPTGLFGKSISVVPYVWKYDTTTSEKFHPSRPKLNCHWSLVQRKLCILGQYILPHTDKEVHEPFYGKYVLVITWP